jgi:hypothetical protein
MFCCYLDESGTPEGAAQTSHFVLLGIAIPAYTWHIKDAAITGIKQRFGLSETAEIHTGFIARRFPEQETIPGFEAMQPVARRAAMLLARKNALIRLVATGTADRLKQTKKLYAKTADYVHLSFTERHTLLEAVADEVSRWASSAKPSEDSFRRDENWRGSNPQPSVSKTDVPPGAAGNPSIQHPCPPAWARSRDQLLIPSSARATPTPPAPHRPQQTSRRAQHRSSGGRSSGRRG